MSEKDWNDPPFGKRSIHQLTMPLYQAMGVSMLHTGLAHHDGTPAYTHDDYDEAMACLSELVSRAMEAHR